MMKVKKLFVFSGSMLVVLFLVFQGCNSQECKGNEDCTKVTYCSNGKCVVDCTSNKDCEVGKTCSSRGSCVDGSGLEKEDVVEERTLPRKDGGLAPVVCENGKTKHCFEAEQSLVGVGLCRQGQKTCINGAWGPCKGQVQPRAEVCDGFDNDCDGKVDEDTCPVGSKCHASSKKCKEVDLCDAVSCPQEQICDNDDGRCKPRCFTNGKCGKDEYCLNGICKKTVYARQFEKCGNTGTICQRTSPKLHCVQLGLSNQSRYCVERCSGPKDHRCKGECLQMTDGFYVCSPLGGKNLGEVCQKFLPDTKTLDRSQQCNQGATCLGMTIGNRGICSKIDQRGCRSGTCSIGSTCLSLGDIGACVQGCSSNPKLCKQPETSCQQVSNLGKFCAPKPVYGPKKYGETCSPRRESSKFGCEKGSFCITADNSFKTGYCSTLCSPSQPCPSITNSSGQTISGECWKMPGGYSECRFVCNQGNPCPNNMTCVELQTTRLCLPSK